MGEQDLTDRVLDAMPEPNPTALELEQARESEQAQLRDRLGREFDSALHATDALGQPRLTKDGFLAIRPGLNFRDPAIRARAAEGRAHARVRSTVPKPPGIAATVPESAPDFKAISAVTVDTITGLCQMLLGEEWRPGTSDGVDERAHMVAAWEAYYRAKGIREVPPGLLLALVMGGYALPRLQKPTTREKLSGLGSRLRARWSRRKGNGDARPHSGPDREREELARDRARH
jgi:hypothetical protein